MRRSTFGLLILGISFFALIIGGMSSSSYAQGGTPPVIVSIIPNSSIYNQGMIVDIDITVNDADQTLNTLVVSLSAVTPATIPGTVTLLQPNVAGIAQLVWDTSAAAVGVYVFNVTVTDSDAMTDTDQISFFVAPPPTATHTPSPTPGPTDTPTLTPTFPPLPSITPLPTQTPIPTATFIPPLATETPLPRPQNAGQAVPLSGARIRFVTNRDGVNVRRIPAIGAPLEGIVNAGYTALAEAISGDGEWLRFNYLGNDAWIGFPTISVIEGDVNALPIADPRTIPYGGFENPRAGLSSADSPLKVRLADSGLRVRSGPGLGYPVLGNAPRYEVMALLGRNETGDWLQVNFSGTLGWIATRYVEFTDIAAIQQLPVGGIVADALPISRDTFSGYVDTLKLLLSRIDLAIPSLEQIRAVWTAAALGEGLHCGTHPIRPTDYAVPNSLLAAFYGTLNSLSADFNSAMTTLRGAIDLLDRTCGQGGQADQGTIQQALDMINQVDGLFGSLRARLIEEIPPDFEFDPNQACLFTFNNRSQVVNRLVVNVVQSVRFDRSNFVAGFCFDGEMGRSYKVEILAYTGNPRPRASVSDFDNPTNFLAVGQAHSDQNVITLSPILIPTTGRYIVIMSDLAERQVALEGDIAILLTDVTGLASSTSTNLGIDPVTGNLVINPVPNTGVFGTPIPGTNPFVTTPVANVGACPNITYTCQQIRDSGGTCQTALACYQAGNFGLDGDADGIPCEIELCTP